MDARVLDVLHDPADHDAFAIGERVHVTFKRVLEESIDEDRPFLRYSRRRCEVFLERMRVVDDLHGAPAEDIRRPDEHRIADPLRRG